MKHIRLFPLLFSLFLAAFLVSCSKDDGVKDPVDPVETGNMIINNDISRLNKRVQFRNELVPIDRNYIHTTKSDDDAVDYTGNFAFKLKADVDPPVYQNKTLMATHVAIKDNYAFVSYNLRGDEYGGAVEVFDVTNISQPVILSQAIFPKADINSIDYADGKLFIVGATEDYYHFNFEDPAFFQVISLNTQMQIIAVDVIIDVPSYSANGIQVSDSNIFVTSGDNGGITIFDRNYSLVKSEEIFDARSVASNSDFAYILSGQPGTINVFDLNSSDFVASFTIGGANTPFSKSEISVNDSYIFAALNEEGVRMMELDGTIKQHIPKPETPEGADDENHVTNSVSLNNSLIFMGNGESGIAVGEIIEELDDQVVIHGTMAFNDMGSSNFVQSRDSIIFVASGLGGLKILAISVDEGIPDDIIPGEPCPTLMDAITLMFPESENAMLLHPYLFEEGVTLNVTVEEETNVYIKFIWEGAGWKNTFGYYAYPAENPPTSIEDLQKHVVFPNASMVGSGGGLEPGDMVQLGDGPFPANTVIGFYLVAQGWANGQMVEGIYTHYTNIAFNENNNQQHLLFIENGCEDLVLTFEDIMLPGGDKDFNDIILVIKDNDGDFPNTKFNVEGIITLSEDDM
jgi:hypothetical protein